MIFAPLLRAVIRSRRGITALLVAALTGALMLAGNVGLGSAATDTFPEYELPCSVAMGTDCVVEPGDPGGGGGAPPAVTTCAAPTVTGFDSTDSYTPDCGTGYRLHAETYRLRWEDVSNGFKSARMQSYIRFERSSGSGVDATTTYVRCNDNSGDGYDQDGETNATKTTLSFSAPPVPRGALSTSTCEHRATYGGVTYTATTVTSMFAPLW